MDVSDFLVHDNKVVLDAWAKLRGRIENGEDLQLFDAMRTGIIAGYEAALRDNGLPPLTNKYVEGLDKRIAAKSDR